MGSEEYLRLVRGVAAAHIDELRGDLDRARKMLRESQARSSELERQVATYQALVDLAGDGDEELLDSRLTLHAAMAAVLEKQPGRMMRAADLATEITRQGLYWMRDGRPVETQQIHARAGNYSHLFTREGTFIKLIEQD